MRPLRKTLGIGVQKQHRERNWRKPEGEPVQLSRSQDKNCARNNDERADERGREMASRKCASASARIGCIDGSVRETIESHSGTAGCDHGNHDPEELMNGGKARRSQHGSAKRKWEHENRMLPLDHFQRNAQAAQNRHIKIVKQPRLAKGLPIRDIALSTNQRDEGASPKVGDGRPPGVLHD